MLPRAREPCAPGAGTRANLQRSDCTRYTLVITKQKGGVCRTTIAALLDLDTQKNLTRTFARGLPVWRSPRTSARAAAAEIEHAFGLPRDEMDPGAGPQ